MVVNQQMILSTFCSSIGHKISEYLSSINKQYLIKRDQIPSLSCYEITYSAYCEIWQITEVFYFQNEHLKKQNCCVKLLFRGGFTWTLDPYTHWTQVQHLIHAYLRTLNLQLSLLTKNFPWAYCDFITSNLHNFHNFLLTFLLLQQIHHCYIQ